MPEGIARFILTDHATQEAERRGLTADIVRRVVEAPEETEEIRPGRIVAQSRIPMGNDAKIYLVRVFVDVDRHPAEIVTAYRTSKIQKYWRGGA